MRTPKRISLATGCLALVLTAGCSDDPDPADTDAAGGTTATPTTVQGGDQAGADSGAVTFPALTGDSTRLSLDDGVTDALSGVGVDLTATGEAQMETSDGTTTFTFPVTGGQATVDPAGSPRFTGTVEHEGGLQLSALGRSATADQLVLDGEQEQLTAVVEGRRVPLLPLVTDPQVTADGEEQVTVDYSAASIDTGTAQSIADRLGLPTLPDLEVNSLQTTLEGS
jgi:hypothetical protein